MHSAKLLNVKKLYRGIPMSEIAAYNWEANMGVNNGYHIWNHRLGVFSWKRSSWYDWLPEKLPKF